MLHLNSLAPTAFNIYKRFLLAFTSLLRVTIVSGFSIGAL